MKEKVLITGANGHLGKKLILASDEYDVCALVRSEKAERDLMDFIEGHNKKNVEIVKGDYLDVSTMKQLVSSSLVSEIGPARILTPFGDFTSVKVLFISIFIALMISPA